MKKLFVVSDVHGHYTILKEALDRAGFDKHDPEHLLICCGDYFDRGNENMEVLRFFEGLRHKVLLRGNHEDLLLKLLQTGKLLPHHYINGTMSTLRNIFGKYAIDPVDDTIDFSGKTRITDRHCDFIGETLDYYETARYVFVHGWLPEQGQTPEERRTAGSEAWAQATWARWNKRYIGQRPLADKTLVCGHVPTFFAGALDPTREKNCADIIYGNSLIAIDAGTADDPPQPRHAILDHNFFPLLPFVVGMLSVNALHIRFPFQKCFVVLSHFCVTANSPQAFRPSAHPGCEDFQIFPFSILISGESFTNSSIEKSEFIRYNIG